MVIAAKTRASTPVVHQTPVLLRTKLRPPTTTPHFVCRTRLIDQLDAVVTCPLTLVIAPAGSGKTQVVANWAETTTLRTAWLSLDESDNDPIEFWSGVCTALDQLSPGCAADAFDELNRGARSSAVVGSLLDRLEALDEQRCVLVIDDIHLLNDTEPTNALSLFVRHLPHWMHVMLVGRCDPALPLERLRGRGQLAEIRFEDLKLAPDEARLMLARLSPSLSEGELDRAAAHTDGWAAGLQLIALAARSAEARGAPVAIDADVALLTDDYVWSEVLGSGDPDVVDLLVAISVVDRADADLADAISVGSKGRQLLTRAVAQGLFVSRLGADGWFRVHALVREVLYRELVRQDRHRVHHERAAAWLERAGETVGALDQWLLAERPTEALRLVASRSTELYDRGRESVIVRTIEAVPRNAVADDPGALIDLAVGMILFSRPTFVAAVEEAEWHAERSQAHDWSAQIDALQSIALVASGSWSKSEARAKRALEAMGDQWWNDPAGRFAWNSLARALALSEGWDDSSEFVRDATIAMRRDPERFVSLEGIRSLGLASAGRPVDAIRVVAGVQHAATSKSILSNEIGIAEAIARREIGDRERCLTLLHSIADQPPSPRLYTSVAAILTLAAAAIDDGHIALAAEHLEHGRQVVSAEDGGVDLHEWLDRMATDVALESGDPATAAVSAASVLDSFWGPICRARVALATGDSDSARRVLEAAEPRCVRHRVVLGLVLARATTNSSDALQHVTRALELACSSALVQTVASEGREVFDLIERSAWAVSGEWLDRVRVATKQRRLAPDSIRPGYVEPLTARERDVLRLLPSRLTVSEIASELYISVNTLKFHLKVIYRKLGVHSRKEAAELARAMANSTNR